MKVEERFPELNAVWEKYINVKKQAPNEQKPTKNANDWPVFVNDDDLIQKAFAAKNGWKFKRLFQGDITMNGSDDSRADLALCNLLAFWTGRDMQQMDRIFRSSGLMRPKWDEKRGPDSTYGLNTIREAIAKCFNIYDPVHCPEPPEAIGQQEPPEIDTGFDALVNAADQGLPRIIITNRDMGELSDEVLKSLESANNPPIIFVRAGALVRIDKTKDKDEKLRPVIKAISESALRGRMARTAKYFKVMKDTKKNGVEYSAANSPIDTVRDVMSLPEESWQFPYLTGLTQIPILRKNGTISSVPGYDKDSSLYYLPENKLNISLDMKIEEAVSLLNEIYCDFPFDGIESRANCLGLLLTLVLRELIDGPVPLAIIDKPQQGTGASLLTNVNSLISTGVNAFMEAWPAGRDKENELRKRITSMLVEGRSQIVIDNIDSTFESAVLGLVLTCTSWQDRALGENKLITLPHRTVWMVTGNNVKPAGDIPRRCYLIRLDAKQARPWQRTGFKHPNLLEWVKESRSKILSAIFKLAQEWIYAGKPVSSDLPTIGNFEEWTKTIGNILHFAGIKGFLGNLETMYEKSEQDDGWEAFLESWYSELGANALTLKEVNLILMEKENFSKTLPENLNVNDKGFTRQLGHAIKRKEGMVYPNNLYIERTGTIQHAIKWRVSSVSSMSSLPITCKKEENIQENIYTYKGTARDSRNSYNSHIDDDDLDAYARTNM